ncbi:MAG: TIGR01777 family oxidoreductase [Pedobacter sp.]|nr:TIGR01777 family oxidoreductase [Pedobacter sp.]MDQ8054276.1 TIGR01777 family oxidoreductase [Pedobacter sp.]
MNRKIVIAGGTGFIGKYLSEKFQADGYEVLVISRQPDHIQWDNEPEMVEALEQAELLINLAGKSVNCRYDKENKMQILKSRTETTTALGNAILKCKQPPQLWINSSTATIYRHAEDRPMSERNGEIGSGFSVNVAKRWEASFFSFDFPKTRQIALRMAIVLGKGGGVMQPLTNLVRFGLGGKQGSGNQMFSWIHIDDLYQMIIFLQEHKELDGIFNCASPNPVSNQQLMQTFRQVMEMPIGLPAPAWLLSIGAIFIKTETELVLKSRWVIPERLQAQGFNFKFPFIKEALGDILRLTKS